ncbi:MAG: tRNA uridine-5-carboxymethylaminomethyl(34) synthesis GTPase MnmE [Spirochaetia bacterium]|nr:tRNA uridine-5-carboxymethylaminomethyl(34) synthesis GTPase MnmE [Spirochaetia bacterium]
MARPICALATPIGRSPVAIIRMSGENTFKLIEKIFSAATKVNSLQNSHKTALYGYIRYNNVILDEVILLPFKKPHSYTGEESAEIQCHGNPIIIKKLLHALYEIGFEKAQPGEFTKRAFLNNKLDLTQAEAVKDIIEARSDKELQSAQLLKTGEFRKVILEFKSSLLNLYADLSAELDFCDEDIEFISFENKLNTLSDIVKKAKSLLLKSNEIQKFREGLEAVIFGAPNVGKSSLLNHFAGIERAIVSEIPGTTRDFLEIELTIDGISLKLIDTAGIHQKTIDNIEKEGMLRSIQKTKEADIIFILLDGSITVEDSFLESPIFELAKFENLKNASIFFLLNKQDIAHKSWQKKTLKNIFTDLIKINNININSFKDIFFHKISLKTNEGLDSLHEKLRLEVQNISPHFEGIMMAEWQKDIFNKIIDDLNATKALIVNKEPLEIILSSLQNAIDNIALLLGDIKSEDILGRIFSRFCIGK